MHGTEWIKNCFDFYSQNQPAQFGPSETFKVEYST